MHIKDHSAAMKFFRTYDNVASKGKWKEFVDEMEFESMLQEPRTMAQEPRNMYAGGQLVRNTVDGSRPGYSGYPPSQFADYGSRHKGFNQWLKDNKVDFKNAVNKRDVVLKFERSQIAKNYITPNELARVLTENGSPYGDVKNFADQFRLASLKEGKDKVLNAKIKKAKKLVKIVNDEFGIERLSLKDINKEFEALSHRPTEVSLGTGKFPERYIKIDKTFNKKMNKVIKGLDQEFGKVGFKVNTIDNIFSLYDDKKFMTELANYKGGKVDPKSYLFKKAFQSGDKAYAFMQLGRVLKGEIDLEGITSNKNSGNKIIKSMVFDSVGKKYGPMWNASYNYAKFQLSPYMKKNNSYESLAQVVRKSFKDVGISAQNIDEVFPLRTGQTLGEGSNAYSNIVQVIDKEINQGAKVAFDKNATSRYKKIISARDEGNWGRVNELVEEHKTKIDDFYKENPKARHVKLTELKYNPKTRTFASPTEIYGKDVIPSKILKGMEKFHQKTGLSLDVGSTTTLETAAEDLRKVANTPKKQMEILKKMGYRCLKASGAGEDLACYMEDVKKTKVEAKKGNPNAIFKQRKAFDIGKDMKGFGKILRRGVQMGTAAITKPLEWLGLTSGLGYAIEGLIEGGIYDYYKRQGYSNEQAFAETFSPRLVKEGLEGKSTEDVPWYGGAEELIEKEKIGTRWDPSGKVNVAAKYADAKSKYDDAMDKYISISNDTPRSAQEGEEQAAALAEQEQILLSLESSVKPGTPEYEAYQQAEETQTALMDERRREYLEKVDPGFLEREQESFDPYVRDKEGKILYKKMSSSFKKREKEMEEWKEGKDAFTIKPGEYIDWAAYGLDDDEGIKAKWKQIYEHGGMDLLDRIGIAGGVSKMADGGIAGLMKKYYD